MYNMENSFIVAFCKRVNGDGLFVNKEYTKGSVIYTLEGYVRDLPDKYSIEISECQHITDKYGVYMNHSFDPTIMIRNRDVVALRDIKMGDEMCFNDNHNETSMACPFETPEGMVVGSVKQSSLT